MGEGGSEALSVPDWQRPDSRMDGYYFGFDRTGVAEIDWVLSAVAIAGKSAHHTEDWSDGLVEMIQAAAIAAAASIRGETAARDWGRWKVGDFASCDSGLWRRVGNGSGEGFWLCMSEAVGLPRCTDADIEAEYGLLVWRKKFTGSNPPPDARRATHGTEGDPLLPDGCARCERCDGTGDSTGGERMCGDCGGRGYGASS